MRTVIPLYEYFENRNIFTGSTGRFNVKLAAGKESIKVYTWVGKFCLDKTPEFNENEFEQSEDGYNAALEWISAQENAALSD